MLAYQFRTNYGSMPYCIRDCTIMYQKTVLCLKEFTIKKMQPLFHALCTSIISLETDLEKRKASLARTDLL